MKYLRLFESNSDLENHLDTLNDILQDLRDDGFIAKANESINAGNIIVSIFRRGDESYQSILIADYINRCVDYMRSEGYVVTNGSVILNSDMKYDTSNDDEIFTELIIFSKNI